jgi:hypothetical protein
MLPELPGPNVIVLPFPIEPHTIKYRTVAKILDFIAWKRKMTENNGKTNGKTNGEDKTLEEFEQMGPSDQKLFVIRKLLEVMDQLDNKDIADLYRILTKPDNGA